MSNLQIMAVVAGECSWKPLIQPPAWSRANASTWSSQTWPEMPDLVDFIPALHSVLFSPIFLTQYFYYSVSKNTQLPSCTTVHKDAQIQNGCDLSENCRTKQETAVSLFCSWRHTEVQICLRAREGQKGHKKKEYCDREGLSLCLRVQTQAGWWVWWMGSENSSVKNSVNWCLEQTGFSEFKITDSQNGLGLKGS